MRPKKAGAALLVEIGCEEIPSEVMENTLRQMGEKAGELFAEHRIDHEELRVLGTPRRLVLTAELALMQRASVQEVLGPARRIAYDAQGNPTAAALGFARAQGIDPALLKIKATDRGEYVCVIREEKWRPTAERLRDLIPRWLSSLSFPRSMRWNGSGVSFVRPIRWIVSLLGGEEIPFHFAGVPSGRISRGHAILSPAPFRVSSREQYFRELKKRFVEVDPEIRYGKIKREVDLLAKKKGGSAPHDEELLWQATFSTEWPTALWGEFDPGFLLLPPEVIMSVLREQQGYFPVLSGEKLLSCFILVGNVADPSRVVRAGNERVLRARLVDAQFYFEADRKVNLSDRVEGLRGVGFLPRLGSMFDKTERLAGLSGTLAERIDPAVKPDAERAARLSKADLLSGVIREFPNLQGVMGREYARLSGEREEVALAIAEQYLPRAAGDRLPETLPGKLVSIADKIDTITGCYSLGLIPTGSQDPYGLRRQGIGVLRICVEGGLSVSLSELIGAAAGLLGSQIRAEKEVQMAVLDAFLDWMRSYQRMREEPAPHDLVEAVLSMGMDDPQEVHRRIDALAEFRNREDFQPLIIAFKRAARIVPKDFTGGVDPARFEKPSEGRLHELLSRAEEGCSGDWEAGAYQDYLHRLASLKSAIDTFFDEVMVMAEDPKIRSNRLALLQRVVTLFDRFGDFRKIQEGGA